MRRWSSILPATSWHSAQQLVEALRGSVAHLLHCGTIWVHGPSVEVPTTEAEPRRAIRRLRAEKGCDRGLSSARGTHISAAGNNSASRAPCRAGLGSGQSRGQLQPGGLLQAAAGEPDPAPEHRDGDGASCPCGRCGAMLSTSDRAEKRRAWRELSRGIARGVDPAGICGACGRVVRTCRPAGVLTLGRVATGSDGEGRRGDLGPHCALAELQHCQSTYSTGI